MSRSGVSKSSMAYYFALVRQKFLRLTTREKVLILLVIGVMFYYWSSNHLGRQGQVWSAISVANFTGKTQQAEIDEEPSVRATWEAAVAEVPYDELLTREEVNGKLDEMLRRYASTRFNLRTQEPDIGDPLSFHTFQAEVSRIDFNSLYALINEIQTTLPYVTLMSTKIRVAGSNRSQLNATLQLRAIEYTK